MTMSNADKILGILDFIVLFGLITLGCFTGKAVMNTVTDTVLGFNGPAIGVLAFGELIWNAIRKKLQKRWDSAKGNNRI